MSNGPILLNSPSLKSGPEQIANFEAGSYITTNAAGLVTVFIMTITRRGIGTGMRIRHMINRYIQGLYANAESLNMVYIRYKNMDDNIK